MQNTIWNYTISIKSKFYLFSHHSIEVYSQNSRNNIIISNFIQQQIFENLKSLILTCISYRLFENQK
jgi:hypothetical protein